MKNLVYNHGLIFCSFIEFHTHKSSLITTVQTPKYGNKIKKGNI